MGRALVAGLALGVLASGCQLPEERLNTITPQPAMQPAPAPPNASYIPAGTVLTARLATKLSTDDTKIGDTFTATVQDALVAQNGETVIPAGAVITGIVTGVGSAEGQSAIRLNFTRINIANASHPFTANITSTHVMDVKRDVDDVARAAAVGATVGAVLGAVVGDGSLRDLLIGGALGAGAGTIISLGIGDVDHVLPEGTHLTLQTTDRIELPR